MIPPTRWRDDPSTPQGLRDVLRAGRPSRPLPSDLRRRSASRIHRLVFVPAAAGVVFWIKSVAIAGLCVVGTAAVVRLAAEPWHVPASPAPAPTTRAYRSSPTGRSPIPLRGAESAPAPVGIAETPSIAPSATKKTVAPSERRPQPATSAAVVDSAPRDSLASEAAMLEQARAMLEGNPLAALTALDAYATRFPGGQLAMEGELLAVDALRRLGRTSEAKARGAALLDRAHGSLYEPRIRTMMVE
jgi:hypothetical protein